MFADKAQWSGLGLSTDHSIIAIYPVVCFLFDSLISGDGELAYELGVKMLR